MKKKTLLTLLVLLNLTGCVRQRIWLLETAADALDPHPVIEHPAE